MILVLLAVLLVGEVTAQVVDSAGPASEIADNTWATGVAPIIQNSTALAATLTAVRERGATYGRSRLEADLAALLDGCETSTNSLSTLGLEAPSRKVGGLLGEVLDDRLQGVKELIGGVNAAIGPEAPVAATAAITRAGGLFRHADAAYLQLRAALKPTDGRGKLPPSSRWIGDTSAWAQQPIAAWAATLHASPRLRSRSAIALVAVSIEPPAIGFAGVPTTTIPPATTTTIPPATTTSSTSTTSTSLPGGPTTSSFVTTTHPPRSTTTTIAPTTTTLQTLPQGAVSILPPTASVTVVVVVSDAGAGAEPAVVIVARLAEVIPVKGRRGRAATGPATVVTDALGTMQPAESRFVSMPAFKVTVGATYVVVVTAGSNASGDLSRLADSATDTFTVKIG